MARERDRELVGQWDRKREDRWAVTEEERSESGVETE